MSADIQGLAGIEPRYTEVGRLRMGRKVAYQKDGETKYRPEKLETWRLTSRSEGLILAAAELFGGSVMPWEDAPGAARQWELITEVKALPVVVPSGRFISFSWELWKASKCERRCDGTTEQLSRGPCRCPDDIAERRRQAGLLRPTACKPHVRLSVNLPWLPGMGVWRLETHSYHGAAELAGAAQQLVALAAGRDRPVLARLELEWRTGKDEAGKTVHFAVPVLDPVESMVRLNPELTGPAPAGELGQAGDGRRELEAGKDPETGGLPDGPPVSGAAPTQSGAGRRGQAPADRDSASGAAAKPGPDDLGPPGSSGPTSALEQIEALGHTEDSALAAVAGKAGWADLGGRNAKAKLRALGGARLRQLLEVLRTAPPPAPAGEVAAGK